MKFVALASFVASAAPVALAQGIRVNAPVVAGGTVTKYTVSADGTRMFYAASQTTPGTIEIHDVPLDGSQATRPLSAPLVAGRSCSTLDPFRVSPDEGQLLYLADQDIDNQFELYSVPTDGTRVSTKLSHAPPVGAGYQWTPDGARVVFGIGSTIYSVPADASQPPVHLNPGKNSSQWAITPDSSRVVFRSNQLYTVPIDGSSPAQPLTQVPYTDFVSDFEITAGGYVVYQGVLWSVFEGEDGREDALYTIAADGSGPAVRILGPFVTYAWEESGFQLTPDTTRALYVSPFADALYTARVDGLDAARLSPNSFPNFVRHYRSSPEGDAVVFVCSNAGQSGLFISPTDGSTDPILLFGPVAGTFIPAEIGPDRVAFLFMIDGHYELCSVPRDGSEPFVVLSGPMVNGGNVNGSFDITTGFEISPSGRSVTYLADQDTDGVDELYVVPIDGQRSSRKLCAPPVAGGDVKSFIYLQGSDFVLYLGDQATDGSDELFMSQYRALAPLPKPATAPPAPRTVTSD